MQLIERKNKITFVDFGGEGPVLHFAHANGYPPRIYRKLLLPFTAHFRVIAMHQRPLWPGTGPMATRNWKEMAKDMIAFFEEQKINQVIGMGHSMGAVVSLYAAQKRPDLFQKLVFIEPVFLPPNLVRWTQLIPMFWRRRMTPPAIISSKRRDTWPSKAEAFDFFRSKKVFSLISDEVLRDYVEYGLKPTDTGEQTLTFSKEWETRVYTMTPNPWSALKQLKIPSMGIRGEFSNVINEEAWKLWQKRQPKATFINYANSGHLVPQEYPEELVKDILRFLGF